VVAAGVAAGGIRLVVFLPRVSSQKFETSSETRSNPIKAEAPVWLIAECPSVTNLSACAPACEARPLTLPKRNVTSRQVDREIITAAAH